MPIQNAVGPLRRVYVREPRADDLAAWETYGWRSAPDTGRIIDEHAAFRAALTEAGADVVLGRSPVAGDPDAIYAYDPTLMTDEGAVLLRPGKEGRRDEPSAAAKDLIEAGVPILGELEGLATAEGGDMFWLDGTTLLIGRGYRTNGAGVDQIRAFLEPGGVTVHVFDLQHFHGPAECLHLMSFISPLDRDLALVFLPMVPVRLVQLLADHGVSFVEVPPEEFDTLGPNVLALAPRIALAIDGNDETRRRMESAGVDVRVFSGQDLCRKGDGGPTCLTRPLDRG
jgi:N-dimethylarginine dimethylaminohydrolase